MSALQAQQPLWGRSSFQNMLGEKLGALACQLIDDHYIVDFPRDEVQQLQAEVLELRRQLAEQIHVKIEEVPPSPIVTPAVSLQADLDGPASATSQDSIVAEEAADVLQISSSKMREIDSFCSGRQTKGTKTHSAEELDLLHTFSQFDPLNLGYIDIQDLLNVCRDNFGVDVDEEVKEETLLRIRTALHSLNKFLGIFAYEPHSRKPKTISHLSFEAFKLLMIGDPHDLEKHVDDVNSLLVIRELLVDSSVVSQVAKVWKVSQGHVREWRVFKQTKAEKILEPLVAVMIILNSLTIGISLDLHPTWDGWFVFEAFFTMFFLGEFWFRVRLHGCFNHFLGHDSVWSIFDFLLVAFAVTDTTWTFLSKVAFRGSTGLKLNQLTILRLARLLRITRIVRLVRLSIFKELALMINGVISGLRTLFWAMVLLIFFIYSLGVAMKQMTNTADAEHACKDAFLVGTEVYITNGTEVSVSQTCNRGQLMMTQYGQTLFENVARCMLTVFNCFTDGCNVPDGTPLVWYIWDTHGGLMVIAYVFAYLFVVFGVFNLVMAVFVENTFAQAWKHRQERQFGNHSGHVAHAHHLHKLLSKLCRERYAGNSFETLKSKSSTPKTVSFAKSAKRTWGWLTGSAVKRVNFEATSLQMRVSQEMFEYLLQDASVQVILDDLEISHGSREHLFAILDSDGNGYLAITELVEGIMRLRGPSDKGDAVSTLLMVRCMQKQMRKFEAEMHSSQDQLYAAQEELKTMLKTLQSTNGVNHHHTTRKLMPHCLSGSSAKSGLSGSSAKSSGNGICIL